MIESAPPGEPLGVLWAADTRPHPCPAEDPAEPLGRMANQISLHFRVDRTRRNYERALSLMSEAGLPVFPGRHTDLGFRLGASLDRTPAVEDSVTGAESARAAGIPTVGLVQFVPPDERAERAGGLHRAGVSALLSSWTELDRHLLGRSVPSPA